MKSLIELLRSKRMDKFPKYISNKELMDFLNENKGKVDKDNFLAFGYSVVFAKVD